MGYVLCFYVIACIVFLLSLLVSITCFIILLSLQLVRCPLLISNSHNTHTTLFAIKGRNNKKKLTKQRKSSKIKHCNISQTQQDNTIQYYYSDSRGNYSATSNNTKLVHWPLMGELSHLVQRGGAWAGCGPAHPLLAVPNVTANPSTANVPITVLLYDGLLLCGFNVAIKWLINACMYVRTWRHLANVNEACVCEAVVLGSTASQFARVKQC